MKNVIPHERLCHWLNADMPVALNADNRIERLLRLLVGEVAKREDRRRQMRAGAGPAPHLNLSTVAGLSDIQVARTMASGPPPRLRALASAVRSERASQRHEPVLPGRRRCEAGLPNWGMLQCTRLALPSGDWCWQHDPTPRDPQTADRVTPADLAARPDGEVLRALYVNGESLDELVVRLAHVSARLEILEQRIAGPTTPTAQPTGLLDVKAAAELLGVAAQTVYRLTKAKQIPYVRVGSLIRFKPEELQVWLTKRQLPAVK